MSKGLPRLGAAYLGREGTVMKLEKLRMNLLIT